jgi:DNA polymerase
MNLASKIDILDTLAWHAEMGVDLCIEAKPQVLRRPVELKAVEPAPTQKKTLISEPKTTATPTPSLSVAAAVAEARALADVAADLPTLEAAVRGFTGCSLKKTATNTVFAEGAPQSRLMFIGEAPGAEEDRAGVPFCGPSGKLLDLMLSFIGLNRAQNFYITNTLFWRPPGNRQPTPEELEICKPFVEKHIALVNPKILVMVGGTATKSMLNESRGITKIRGQVFNYSNQYMGAPVPTHVIYHPSYLLRQPLAKKQCWADLLALKAALT